MVRTTPPVTTMTLLSRYSPTPLSQAEAKFDHWKVAGSDHGEPKISRDVFTEASRAHANGTSTITDQPIRTTWEKTSTPTPARPVLRPSPGRGGAVAGVPLSPVRVVTAMAGPSVLDPLAPGGAQHDGGDDQGEEEQDDTHRRRIAGAAELEAVLGDLEGDHLGGVGRSARPGGHHRYQGVDVEGEDRQVHPGGLDRVPQQRDRDPEEGGHPPGPVDQRRLVDVPGDRGHGRVEQHQVEPDAAPDQDP